ncbi:MAG: alpha/beta hydrolase [Paenibacillus sp.]|nr:alpha/beta hydrolase [Paenibacillus sp.]
MGYFIEVEQGVKLYVEDIGTGKPVVFIHGWPVNHKMYEYQVTQLPRFGFRCIQIDLRGFGQSDCPWHGYSYDRLSDDIATVIQALRLPHFTLVGFSMGGAIAIRYMSRHRGYKVSQLILLAAAAPSFTQRPGYPHGMTREAVDQLIAQTLKDRPAMLEKFGEQFFASSITPSFRNWFQLLGLQASSHGTIAGAISLRDEDLRQDLARVHAPTHIFHGVLDQICPYVFAELMHQGIAGSVLHRFDKSGHGIFYDELEKFNNEFFRVLQTNPNPY